MRNKSEDLQPYSGTIISYDINGLAYNRTTTNRMRQHRRLFDVLPQEPPYPSRDVSLPRAHTYKTDLLTACTGTFRTIEGPLQQGKLHVSEPVYPGSVMWPGLLTYSDEHLDAYALATNQLLQQIRNSNLMLGASLAEGRQSVAMVGKAVRSALTWKRSALSALKDWAEPLRNGSKRAADKWLEYTYGWVPLMQDVHAAAAFHRSWLLERQIKARSGLSRPLNTEDGGAGAFWRRTSSGSASYRVELCRRIRVTNPQLFDLQRLGVLNPLSITWELLPFSFVADWFVDIGGYLEGLETACGLGYTTVTGGYDTYTVRVRSHTNVGPGDEMIEQGYRSYSGTGAYTGSYKSRQLNSAIPYPRIPGFTVNLGARRIISAGALVRQRF